MKAIRVLCAYVLTLSVCVPVLSQLNSVSINGGVTDPTGAVIPGVTVTVTDVEHGVSINLLTDEAGQYLAPSLTPGTYSVRAELSGFQTVERKNIVVGVGQGIRLDLQLQTGAQTETVTVSESVPPVDTSNEVISNTVETAILSELPINGRLYTKILDGPEGTRVCRTSAFRSAGQQKKSQVAFTHACREQPITLI